MGQKVNPIGFRLGVNRDWRSRWYASPQELPQFLHSDLPELARDLPAGPFPCVKLRGCAAIIALSSAIPRPPFVASGYLGHTQLEALDIAYTQFTDNGLDALVPLTQLRELAIGRSMLLLLDSNVEGNQPEDLELLLS